MNPIKLDPRFLVVALLIVAGLGLLVYKTEYSQADVTDNPKDFLISRFDIGDTLGGKEILLFEKSKIDRCVLVALKHNETFALEVLVCPRNLTENNIGNLRMPEFNIEDDRYQYMVPHHVPDAIGWLEVAGSIIKDIESQE